MMCPNILTGQQFLASVLDHVDCQSQSIGTFGFGALASGGSPASTLLLALLTLFIAIFGVRLMLGAAPSAEDIVGSALKFGIVLTLAASWPAWRTLGYDMVMSGPAQIAATIGGSAGLPRSRQELNQRLQWTDDGIVKLTAGGTGRLAGSISGSDEASRGIALPDQTGFAWGRIAFLAGTLAPLSLVRLASGILLALAPLMAGLMLFGGTRDLFIGWLRALLTCAFASLAMTLCFAVELTIIEGWLRDAITQRNANLLTPATPTELVAITVTFALIVWGVLAIIGKMMFFSGGQPSLRMAMSSHLPSPRYDALSPSNLVTHANLSGERIAESRAQKIGGSLAQSLRIDSSAGPAHASLALRHDNDPSIRKGHTVEAVPLGASFRRTVHRPSHLAQSRDGKL